MTGLDQSLRGERVPLEEIPVIVSTSSREFARSDSAGSSKAFLASSSSAPSSM